MTEKVFAWFGVAEGGGGHVSDELAVAVEHIAELRLEVRVLRREKLHLSIRYDKCETRNRALSYQVGQLKIENERLRSELTRERE